MPLHQGSGYSIEEGYVEIIGGIKLRIIGWDRRYDQYESGEARLVYRGEEMCYGSLRGSSGQSPTSQGMSQL